MPLCVAFLAYDIFFCAVPRAAEGLHVPYAQYAHPGHVLLNTKRTCSAGVWPASAGQMLGGVPSAPMEQLISFHWADRKNLLRSASTQLLTYFDCCTPSKGTSLVDIPTWSLARRLVSCSPRDGRLVGKFVSFLQ